MPGLWCNLPVAPTTAFLRSPPVHGTAQEGWQRVELTSSPSHRRMAGICAFETLLGDLSKRRKPAVADRGSKRLNWARKRTYKGRQRRRRVRPEHAFNGPPADLRESRSSPVQRGFRNSRDRHVRAYRIWPRRLLPASSGRSLGRLPPVVSGSRSFLWQPGLAQGFQFRGRVRQTIPQPLDGEFGIHSAGFRQGSLGFFRSALERIKR